MREIVNAIKLSRSFVRNIHENLFFAFIYNAVGAPIAAGVLYTFSQPDVGCGGYELELSFGCWQCLAIAQVK